MKQYTFCKIRNKGSKEPATWYLLAEDADIVERHWKSYAASYMREGTKQFVNRIENDRPITGHYTNKFAIAVSVYFTSMKCSPFDAFVHIENEALRGRNKLLLDGATFYLDKGMTCLVDNPTIEIIETIIKDTLVFPDEERLDMDDVKYIKWSGGIHWYAKVGKLDIVDECNNQKWNTKEEAHKAAEWFIHNYKYNKQ